MLVFNPDLVAASRSRHGEAAVQGLYDCCLALDLRPDDQASVTAVPLTLTINIPPWAPTVS